MSKKSSLETILATLAEQPEPRDPQKRRRIELLANVLWRKALDDADHDAVKFILEKLPKSVIESHPESQGHKLSADPVNDAVTVLKALTEQRIIPAQLFEMYAKKPDDVTEH